MNVRMKRPVAFFAVLLMIALCAVACSKKNDQALKVWEGVNANFSREDSGQFNNGTLQMTYQSKNHLMFEFKLMKGSESEDHVIQRTVSGVLLVGNDGIGRFEAAPDANNKFSINFTIADDGQKITVDHSGKMDISPDGVYIFIESL